MDIFERLLASEVSLDTETESMALVEMSDGAWRISTVNDRFEAAFDCESTAVAGRRLVDVVGLAERPPLVPETTLGPDAMTTVDVETGGGTATLEVHPLGPVEAGTYALVAVGDTPAGESERTGRSDRVDSPDGTESVLPPVVRMAEADDIESACAAAARLFVDHAGFDAFVADLEDAEHVAGVDGRIELAATAERDGLAVAEDVRDPHTGDRWAVVVQYVLGGGVVQAAARDRESVAAAVHDGVELYCRSLAATVSRLQREQRLRAERDERAMLNRVLRHEIINGLNLIRARLGLIEEDVSAGNRDHYETVRARTDALISHARAVREVQVGGNLVETSARSLGPIVREEAESAVESYPEASFSVVGTVPDVEVRADDLLRLCLHNVLQNAVQHADAEDPDVRVEVRRRDDTAAIRVGDNGPGLQTTDDRGVFGKGATSRPGEGHGEGLYLTAKIVEGVYGGSVAAGESPRGGAEFVIELPVADDR